MTDVETESLLRELRILKDRAEIQDCLVRYCRGVDRLDWELAASAYHPDAIDDRGAITGSPPEYLAWLRPIIEGADGTSHNICNMTFDISGDAAHTEAYVMTAVWMKGGAQVMMGGARYISRFERRDGVWKLAHQEAPMDFTFAAPTNTMPDGALLGKRSREDRSYLRPLVPSSEAQARLNRR